VAYTFEYAPHAIDHIRKLSPELRATVMDQLEHRLAHQPAVPARNRKPMDPDKKMYLAPWELRLGELRVYYAVEEEAKKVIVLAVGIKEREKLFIGGREVEP
jgi:mRNA-degrading endonuclease RelE of RelBE toxin-antitoxin system